MSRKRTLRPPKGIDDLIFPICQKFLVARESADEIAEWANEEIDQRDLGVTFNRQQVYPTILEAVRLGYILFRPPADEALARTLADATDTPQDQIRVLNVSGPDAIDHLASVAAEVILNLIKKRGRARSAPGPMHLGLGAGNTTMHVARHLGKLLRSEVEIPGVESLVLHAMSSGFLFDHPESAPGSFFHLFSDSIIDVSLVGLFSEAMVKVRDYDSHRKSPATRESFDRAGETEIVITSLATADDEDGLFNKMEKKFDIKKPRGKQRVGDVQFRPFSENGPLDDDPDGVRAVTLFDLQDYFRMTQKEDKALVLVAGPRRCGKTRAQALIPLFTEPTLRIWTHAVMDIANAVEVAKAMEALPTTE